MNFMDVIARRRTVRAYTGEPVPRELIDTLLQTAVMAPTGMNLQPWAFGVIEGVDRLKSYSDKSKAYLLEHIDQFPGFERYRDLMADPTINLCHNAPVCVVVYAKPNGATSDNDCTMAAHNIMLAAVDNGLATCWVGFLSFILNQPDVKRELGVPEDYRVVAPIVVGYPHGDIPPVPKNPPEIVYWMK